MFDPDHMQVCVPLDLNKYLSAVITYEIDQEVVGSTWDDPMGPVHIYLGDQVTQWFHQNQVQVTLLNDQDDHLVLQFAQPEWAMQFVMLFL